MRSRPERGKCGVVEFAWLPRRQVLLRVAVGVARRVEGGDGRTVRGNVVGVAVAAARVVGDDDIRPHTPHQFDHTPRGRVGVGVVEVARVRVIGRTDHA